MTVPVDEHSVVTPGQTLVKEEERRAGDGTFKTGNTVKAKYFGTVEMRGDNEVRVIPHHVRYNPQEGDQVVGEIERVSISSYNVDIGCPYSAFLHVNEAVDEYVDRDDDISQWFDIGDLVVGKITRVTKGKDVKMTLDAENCRKLEGGRVIEIPPSKVSRVIGGGGTMVNMIKNATDTHVILGQNGRVWIDGDNVHTAVQAVRKVADNAHQRGLTDKMREWLSEETGEEVQ